MHEPLDDCYLKIERAKEQFIGLGREISDVVGKTPFNVAVGLNPTAGERMFKIDMPPTWPPKWGILVGEIAHNVRSALDYLVFQLASQGGGKPERDGQAFPIAVRESAYTKSRGRKKISYRDRCLKGVEPRWAAMIDELQPFKPPTQGRHALLTLNQLSNPDKHHIRHAVYSRIETSFAFLFVESSDLVRNIELSLRPDGQMTVRSHFRKPGVKGKRMVFGLDPKPNPDGKVGGEVVFGKDCVSMAQLFFMIEGASVILKDFEPAFAD